MEQKNNMEKTSEIQETELEEISGGNFIQDITNADLFQPVIVPMEDTPWMEDITIHGSWK